MFWFAICLGAEVLIAIYSTQVVNALQHFGILDPTVSFDGGDALIWTVLYGTLFLMLVKYICKKCNIR